MSSFFRRSTDASRVPVMFDNPAYRRSMELRPVSCRGSWYDPDAANYEYSITNANLVTRKPTSPKSRSLSSSRLYDKRPNENHNVFNISGSRRSLREYVPKIFHSESDGAVMNNLPYQKHDVQQPPNGFLPRIRTRSTSRGSLPRTPIEDRMVSYDADPFPTFKDAYRSTSFDPGFLSDTDRPETNFYSMENRKSKKRYKQNMGQHNGSVPNREKHLMTRSQRDRQRGDDSFQQMQRSHSVERSNRQLGPSGHRAYTDHEIISSNLHSEPFVVMTRGHNGNIQRAYTSPKQHIRNADKSDRRTDRRGLSVRPSGRDEIYMFQTRL